MQAEQRKMKVNGRWDSGFCMCGNVPSDTTNTTPLQLRLAEGRFDVNVLCARHVLASLHCQTSKQTKKKVLELWNSGRVFIMGL